MKIITLCVSKEISTSINVSPHFSTFVESYSKLWIHDNHNSRKVQADISETSTTTTHIILDNESVSFPLDAWLDDDREV